MGRYAERSCELFKSGANCAQSVFAAFAEVLGLDEEFCLKLASPFGAGMGRLRGVCGAFSGLLMVAGALRGSALGGVGEKGEIYRLTQALAARFRERNGSLMCRDILGLPQGADTDPQPSERTVSFYAKRPCLRIVEDAALMAEELLSE